MRIENRSAFHPTAKLLPVIDFVAEYARYSELATLRVVDSNSPELFTGGYAERTRQDWSEMNLVAPSLITIQMSRGNPYPVATCHVEEVGPIAVDSFEEEFLVVLAHEAAHIDSFYEYGGGRDEHEEEVQAERFAQKLLGLYRKSRATRLRAG